MTSLIWENVSSSIPLILPQTLFAFLIILVSTRLITGRCCPLVWSSTFDPHEPPTIPYWVPYYAHLINLWSTDLRIWLNQWSQGIARPVLAIQVLGLNVKVIMEHKLVLDIFENHACRLTFEDVRWYILVKVFGAADRKHKLFLEAHADLAFCTQQHFGGRYANGMILDVNILVQDHITNLVSTNQSIIDQDPWERASNSQIVTSDPDMKDQAISVEVSLYALIKTFVGHLTVSGFLGVEFMEDHESFLDDLWKLDKCWKHLALGLPRWLPIPGLHRAYAARRELLRAIGSFHHIHDQYAQESSRGACHRHCQFLDERSSIWRTHKTSMDVRTPADLGLIWTMVVKNANVVFWMLLNIYPLPDIVHDLRREIQPYAIVTYTASNSKIAPPPRLKLDACGLTERCPLLRACFYECLRLYSNPIQIKRIAQSLITRASSSLTSESPLSTLVSGTYIAAPPPHVRSDSPAFESPELFRPHRFLRSAEAGKMIFDLGEFNPWGLGPFLCPGRQFAEAQVLSFVAAIIALWEVEPAGNSAWTPLPPKAQSVVATPSKDIRVVIQACRV